MFKTSSNIQTLLQPRDAPTDVRVQIRTRATPNYRLRKKKKKSNSSELTQEIWPGVHRQFTCQMFAPSWLFLFRRWAPLAADGSVGKGKKDQAARDTGKQIACARSGCARTRSPMCRIRHPGINAPSAFTNPDKEGCGNNKPRGKCLQTPKGVELFPPLSLVLFLSVTLSVALFLSLNPCFALASTNSGAALSLSCSLPGGADSPHLIHHGNFAPREHPFPFNFHYQVHTRLLTCVSSLRIIRPFCATSR